MKCPSTTFLVHLDLLTCNLYKVIYFLDPNYSTDVSSYSNVRQPKDQPRGKWRSQGQSRDRAQISTYNDLQKEFSQLFLLDALWFSLFFKVKMSKIKVKRSGVYIPSVFWYQWFLKITVFTYWLPTGSSDNDISMIGSTWLGNIVATWRIFVFSFSIYTKLSEKHLLC